MKLFLYTSSVIFLLLMICSCGISPQKAADHCDEITKQNNLVVSEIEKMDSAFANYYVPNVMDSALNKLFSVVSVAKNNISDLPDLDDNFLKNNALDLLNLYDSVFKNEYTLMVNIYKLADDDYKQEEMDKWEELSKSAFLKISAAQENFIKRQVEFSEKYKFSFQVE
ncbi:MAG: hypothetical protein ABIJ97_17425 [Bacteroidota bacterium]